MMNALHPLFNQQRKSDSFQNRSGAFGYTLTELMIANALILMVMGGVIYSHLVGMQMYEITRAKLGASQEARRALNMLNR